MEYRMEHDTMGQVAVPADKLWGAQTQRSFENFPIGEEKMPADLITAFGVLKEACAAANHKLGKLDDTRYALIQSACHRLWIMTPYLILDDKMISALCVAAKTGVDVRIITPGIPDKWYVHAVTRANYEPLTEAGVRIFEFKPGFIHSKVCLADDQYAVVGTVNMDFRSLYLHFEDAVYLYDSPAVSQVAQDFEETFPVCREMTYARCRHVHFYQRILRALLQVFSPLL